jgi:hypothetical protein
MEYLGTVDRQCPAYGLDQRNPSPFLLEPPPPALAVVRCRKVFRSLKIGFPAKNKQHLHSRHLASYLVYDSEGVVLYEHSRETIMSKTNSLIMGLVSETWLRLAIERVSLGHCREIGISKTNSLIMGLVGETRIVKG